MAALTGIQYATLVLGALDTVRTDIIAPNSPNSEIETRYIASIGFDEEGWLGQLRDDTNNVDIWLLSVASLRGLDEQSLATVPIGTFNKPVTLVMDYYADYKHGKDAVGVVGSETVTNTEREFLKKLLAVDNALERKRGCLTGNIFIDGWDFRIKLRRWEQATTHWASGTLNLRFDSVPVV